jgi:hypothetical protein
LATWLASSKSGSFQVESTDKAVLDGGKVKTFTAGHARIAEIGA